MAVAVRVGVEVVVLPGAALGRDMVEHAIQVGNASGLALHSGDRARRVRDEDCAEAIAQARVVDGLLRVGGDVEEVPVARRSEGELLVCSLHPILPSGMGGPDIDRAERVYGAGRGRFTSGPLMTPPLDLPVSDALLAPLLEVAGAVLRALDAVDVPPALRHLHGIDRRDLARGPARSRLRRAVDSEERFRDRVVGEVLARDEVAAILSSWRPATAVDQAEAAAARGDLPLLVSALWAARPDGFVFGIGAAVAVSTRLQRQWGGETEAQVSHVARLEERYRRAEAEVVAARAEVERVEAVLREERRSLRAREEQAASAVEEARREVAEVESDLAAALKETRRSEARWQRDANRAGDLAAEIKVLRRALAVAQEEVAAAREEVAAAREETAGQIHLDSGGTAVPPEADGHLEKRATVSLPPGLVADSVEGVAAMVRASGVVMLIDGYSVTRRAWADSAPSEQRSRLAMALAQAHLHGWCEVTVVFGSDGAQGVPPLRRPGLRVVFSAAGESVGEAVVREVECLPKRVPVVVASSDARVREHAERAGARSVSAAALLAALGVVAVPVDR